MSYLPFSFPVLTSFDFFDSFEKLCSGKAVGAISASSSSRKSPSSRRSRLSCSAPKSGSLILLRPPLATMLVMLVTPSQIRDKAIETKHTWYCASFLCLHYPSFPYIIFISTNLPPSQLLNTHNLILSSWNCTAPPSQQLIPSWSDFNCMVPYTFIQLRVY